MKDVTEVAVDVVVVEAASVVVEAVEDMVEADTIMDMAAEVGVGVGVEIDGK